MSLAGLKVKVSGLHSFWKVPGQNLFPCLFQLPEAAGISWHMDTSLSSSIATLPTTIESLRSCDYTGPTWTVHGPPYFKLLNHICKTPFAV